MSSEQTPETPSFAEPEPVTASDPNADQLHGDEGGMGVSSERVDGEGLAYRSGETHPGDGEQYLTEDGQELPEQTAAPTVAEPNPDAPAHTYRAEPRSKPGPGL